MELGGVDVIAFTAGVGENVPYLRALIIDNVARALGCHLDHELNVSKEEGNRVISSPTSQVEVMVIPTDEELVIVKDTARILNID